MLTIDANDAETDALTDRLWSAGSTGVAQIIGERAGESRLLAGFDAKSTAAAARSELGGSISPVDPSTWAAPAPSRVEVGGRSLTIDAGRSFGHGGHETTRLCLSALERHVGPGRTVLDVGSGSGVLSLAAAALGATVTAIDVDPVAVATTVTNAFSNDIEVTASTTPIDEIDGMFDVVVANLLVAELEPIGPAVAALATDVVIVSGALVEQQDRVGDALGTELSLIEAAADGEWFGGVYRRSRSEP